MNFNDLNLITENNINVNFDSFALSIFLSIFLSFLVQQFYIKFSTTLSNKIEFSKNFLVLAATTTIIITIVKSSLALSLGLVGALSIVRFRAAIKEPEELVYLFLVISIGLGCGANQLLIVTIGVLIILSLIFIVYKIQTKKIIKNLDKLSLSIIYNYKVNEEIIEKLKKLLLSKSESIKLISLVKSDLNTTLNFQVQLKNFQSLNSLINKIQTKDTKVIVAQSDIIAS